MLIVGRENAQEKGIFVTSMRQDLAQMAETIQGLEQSGLNREQENFRQSLQLLHKKMLQCLSDHAALFALDISESAVCAESFDLQSLLQDIVTLISPLAAQKKLSLLLYVSKEVPRRISTDPVYITQMLTNLLHNAVQHTKEGYVSLEVALLSRHGTVAEISFSVQDTGIGIKKQALVHLLSKERSEHAGLRACEKIANLLGGQLLFTSVYGKGSHFTTTILATVDPKELGVTIPNALEKRVLCFEHNPKNAHAIVRMCDDFDINCDICTDVSEFDAALQEGKYTHIFFEYTTGLYVITKHMHELGVANVIGVCGLQEELPQNATVPVICKPILLYQFADFLQQSGDVKPIIETIAPPVPEVVVPLPTVVPPPSTPEPAMTIDDLWELNVPKAMEILDGDRDIYIAILQSVDDYVPKNLERMETCLQENDVANFIIEVHGVKGALANIGADDLSEMARRLEFAGKANNIAFIEAQAVLFMEDVRQFLARLKVVLGR